MAERMRATAPSGGHRAPVTGVLLAALFTLLGVLGLQGFPAVASTDALRTSVGVAVAAQHGPAPAPALAPAPTPTPTPAKAQADSRTGVHDTCVTTCGQPPRAGRVTAGEWHAPPPGGLSLPPGLVVPLPEAGLPLPDALGAVTPSRHSAQYSGRGPPPPTGI
ncbi:hypothetical protein MUK60_39905 [Streptomyces sp. LRE541]|uniref:hypothetical protein n=1 Tax=Streptomyces sp. LRE541 TaxID=2931983 RepID=UPI00200E3999|nr:hypothetical protein [Streptomyces sp. LRE541]UPZ33420.1 hypothetical protein MUK60_39905 [Streptomyces sp. LRE541]